MRMWILLVVILVVALQALPRKAAAWETGSNELSKWADRVIPLPKEMLLSGTVRVRAGDLAVECSDLKSPQSRTACSLLQNFCLSDGRSRASGAFSVRMLLASEAADIVDRKVKDRLASLPNAAQAYHIEPTSRRDGLVILANTPTGLLFGARTLTQMVEVPQKLRMTSLLEVPLVTVTDWPDILERGQWGGDVTAHAAETAKYKLNVIEQPVKVSVDQAGNPVCALSPEYIASNNAIGVKIVPVITHLEQISRYAGLAKREDVVSKPDPSKPLPSDYVPGLCMSSPSTLDIIGGWLEKIAGTEGVTDIMVWLSEERSPCFCDKCAGKEQFELEVQAITSAFRRAKKNNPGVRLRLLTTQGSYSVNDRVLAAAPPDVGISYYDGSRTYDSSRRPMIYPLLQSFAKSGRWLGVYPQITHSWRTVFPWTAPQFIQYRAREFADKKLSCVIGYAVPSNFCHDFNVLALAEWTWNSHGRTPEEFSRAYAIRRGIKNPDTFARWAMLAGEAGWALAESRLLLNAIYNPTFGFLQGVRFDDRFQHASILESGRLSEALAVARKALDLAASFGDPDMISESRCCLAGLEAFAAVKAFAPFITKESLDETESVALADFLEKLDCASQVLLEEVRAWGERVRKQARWGRLPNRLVDTANALLLTCDGFRAQAAKLGVQDPHPERRLVKVGEWSGDDFLKSSNATLRWDVTELVPPDGGVFNVAFDFVWGSAYGTMLKNLRVVEVASAEEKVVSTTNDPLGSLSRHESHKEAMVTIPARPEGSRLFVELECVGPPADAAPERRTCSGKIGIRRFSTASSRPAETL